MDNSCPIAYDHTDDLDMCALCGWGLPVKSAEPSYPKDMAGLSGPERITEAIKILSGGYAPQQRVLICGPSDLTL